MMTYQEFSRSCSIAWETEGQQAKETHKILCILGTKFGMSRSQKMIGEAWRIYKGMETGRKNKYLINTTHGTQATVVAETTYEAFEIAYENGWNPKREIPTLLQENV